MTIRGKQSRPWWYPVKIPVEALMNASAGLLHLLDANRSLRSLILKGTLVGTQLGGASSARKWEKDQRFPAEL